MIPAEVLKKVRMIELQARNTVESVLSGAYSSSFKGKGMEFAEVREYVPGDEVRSIDWNVTARAGAPFVKKFVEERELTVILAVDASASGEFASRLEMKGEVMATLSALLAFSAIKNNDRVGLLIFTSEVEKFVPPQKGRNHVLRVIRELLYFKPKNKGTDLKSALEYLNRITKRHSVIFLVSDFIGTGFEVPLKLLNRRNDVVALSVRDKREKELPNVGFVELEDAESGETVLVDTGSNRFRKAYADLNKKKEEKLKQLFRSLSVDFIRILVQNDYDQTIQPLLQYFRQRAMRRKG